ncbi:MAG: methylmalonyl-CoA mutase [Pseudonocardiales bacterium]|nr:methylmalonyl-CoA mutase [Pseudonocardiales bacterium]
MPEQPEPVALAGDFPAVTRAEWRQAAAAVLAKSRSANEPDPEAALSHRSYEGIGTRALYTAEDLAELPSPGLPGRLPFTRGSIVDGARGWDVRQRHADPDADSTRAAIQDDLANGVTSVWLVGGDAGIAVGDLATVLDGVDLGRVPIALDAGAQTADAVAELDRLARGAAVPSHDMRGSFGADPLGWQARTGTPADLAVLGELAVREREWPGMCIATVDATIYHDAGASDADELGIATAVGVAYLRVLTDAGLPVDRALQALEFRFAVTDDQFASIAKLRAARRVWGRVAQLCAASTDVRGQRQHAVSSGAMTTQRDPWVNMLRATVACFAAAAGGADAITTLPFDHAIGRPDAFARRIARNTQAILHDEASLARVADPAGGSWYVESRTVALAERAWSTFTDLETAGGALAALEAGSIAKLVATTQHARAEDVARRRAPITGVSEFALLTESAVRRVPWPESPDLAAGALNPHRYAASFETLRDRSDAAAARGRRPGVYLAVLGQYPARGARAGFAADLFRAGGLEPSTGSVEAYRADGAAVTCLVGSDASYEAQGAAAVATLRAAGARQVWLAGTARVPGVDGTLHRGCDALAALLSALDSAGVGR